MIRQNRIMIEYQLNYDNIYIYERGEDHPYPKIFEDDTVIFTKGNEVFTVNIEKIIYFVHKHGKFPFPLDAIRYKRITLNYEIVFQDCHVVAPEYYNRYNIPQLFDEPKQFVFMDKAGIYIASDYHIILAQNK